jgi:two-component system response regulator HydG
MLQKAEYNKKRAAELLNMSRKTLYNKLEKYGISMR